MRFRQPLRRWGRHAGAALLLHGLILAVIYLAWRALIAPPPPPIVVATLLSSPAPSPPARTAPPPPAPAQPSRPPAPVSSIGARAFRGPAASNTNAASDSTSTPSTPAQVGTDGDAPDAAETVTVAATYAAEAIAAQAATRWEAEVLASLDRVKRYPASALSRGQEDVVSVRIRVARSGEVLSEQIADSRGYDALDDEALALIARADPLPPPPPEIGEHDLEFVVPIDFRIEQTFVTTWW
jgi:protein TonB